MRSPLSTIAGRAAAAGVAALLSTGLAAGAASASTAAPAAHQAKIVKLSIIGDGASAGSTGYQLSGAKFRYVHATVYLRQAGQYSSYQSGIGGSVSLWASDGSVFQLGISNSTNPAGTVYSPGVAPFDTTHAQVTSGLNEFWCPAGGSCQAASLGGGFQAGDSVTLAAYYDQSTGNIDFKEYDATGNLFKGWFFAGKTEVYSQARVTTDFGYTPWDQKGYIAAPAAPLREQSWSHAGVTNGRGKQFGLTGYFTTEYLDLTGQGSVTEATPSALNRSHNGFSTSLVPVS